MHGRVVKALISGTLPLLLMGANAWGGDGVNVTITNDSIDDIVVTVYDVSLGKPTVVLSNARINGFTSVPVSVTPDAMGRTRLSWTAVSADHSQKKCGHAEHVRLGYEHSVLVHANSVCGSR